MLRTSCLRDVRTAKYECTDSLEEPERPDVSYPESAILDWESLQEFNECFTKYINWARLREQHNAVFREQLETLRGIEEASDLEAGFVTQIELNRQRISELSSRRTELEDERKKAEWVLNEHNHR